MSTIGPVEYLVVGFPGNEFNGEIAPAIADLVEQGTVRIIDLVFITKDADGDFAAVEFDEHDGLSAFASIDGEIGGVISNEDIEHAAEALEPGSSAALLVWEDLWAKPLMDAMIGSKAVLLEGGRIPHDIIEPVLAGLCVPSNADLEGLDMLRRRPIARAAVTTSVVVGTAERTRNRVDRRMDRRGLR